jgi:hypothetical protein
MCVCDDNYVDKGNPYCEKDSTILAVSESSNGMTIAALTLAFLTGILGLNPFIILGMLDTCQTLSHMVYIN